MAAGRGKVASGLVAFAAPHLGFAAAKLPLLLLPLVGVVGGEEARRINYSQTIRPRPLWGHYPHHTFIVQAGQGGKGFMRAEVISRTR